MFLKRHLEPIWGLSFAILGGPGHILERSWALLGPTWRDLGTFTGPLWAVLRHLEAIPLTSRSHERVRTKKIQKPEVFPLFWKPKGPSWSDLGIVFCHFGGSLDTFQSDLGHHWAPHDAISGRLRVLFGRFCGIFKTCFDLLVTDVWEVKTNKNQRFFLCV